MCMLYKWLLLLVIVMKSMLNGSLEYTNKLEIIYKKLVVDFLSIFDYFNCICIKNLEKFQNSVKI